MQSQPSNRWTPGRIRTELEAKWLQDFATVVLLTTLCSLLAIHFEWTESFFTWTRTWEALELDELAFVFLALAVGLAWFSLRRWTEARTALAQRIETELPGLMAPAKLNRLDIPDTLDLPDTPGAAVTLGQSGTATDIQAAQAKEAEELLRRIQARAQALTDQAPLQPLSAALESHLRAAALDILTHTERLKVLIK